LLDGGLVYRKGTAEELLTSVQVRLLIPESVAKPRDFSNDLTF